MVHGEHSTPPHLQTAPAGYIYLRLIIQRANTPVHAGWPSRPTVAHPATSPHLLQKCVTRTLCPNAPWFSRRAAHQSNIRRRTQHSPQHNRRTEHMQPTKQPTTRELEASPHQVECFKVSPSRHHPSSPPPYRCMPTNGICPRTSYLHLAPSFTHGIRAAR